MPNWDFPPFFTRSPDSDSSQSPDNSPAPEISQAPDNSQAPEISQAPDNSPAPEISQAPDNSQAPELSPAPESSPVSGNSPVPVSSPAPGESKDDEPVESTAVEPEPPGPINPMPWPWIGATAALGAALIAALIAMTVQGRNRTAVKSKNTARTGISRTEQLQPMAPPAQPVPPGAVPQVGKLHQQGARSSQQDCFSVSPSDLVPTYGLLAVVADGMGGLSDGDKVSQAAVAAMMNSFYEAPGQPEEVLLALLGRANNEVNRLLGPDGYSKSGSTVVAGLVRNGKFYSLSVGDSRVCLYRGGALYQLNREHIFRHELEIRAVNGEEDLRTAYTHPRGAGLTSYLGMGQLKYVDMPAAPIDIQGGDMFLLMSDGVYNALTQAELTACLNASAVEAAARLEQAIRAKNYSNQDNYTAVILGF